MVPPDSERRLSKEGVAPEIVLLYKVVQVFSDQSKILVALWPTAVNPCSRVSQAYPKKVEEPDAML